MLPRPTKTLARKEPHAARPAGPKDSNLPPVRRSLPPLASRTAAGHRRIAALRGPAVQKKTSLARASASRNLMEVLAEESDGDE